MAADDAIKQDTINTDENNRPSKIHWHNDLHVGDEMIDVCYRQELECLMSPAVKFDWLCDMQ